MKLSGIAIQKYRSIKRTGRLALGDLTVFVGPNNEGKSNILRAVVTSMRLLRRFGAGSPSQAVRTRLRSVPYYDWTEDFPKDLQEKSPAGNTIIDLWFELSDTDKEYFHKDGRRKTQNRVAD